MPVIASDRGREAIVDEDDWLRLAHHNWRIVVTGKSRKLYVRRDGKTDNGERTPIYLHREIMGPPDGLQVDHISGDTLDNRKVNLRLCRPHENSANSVQRPSASGYRGVYPHRGRYRAMVADPISRRLRLDKVTGRKCIHLGMFDSPDEAARAYDAAALVLFGEFARLNFPAVLA